MGNLVIIARLYLTTCEEGFASHRTEIVGNYIGPVRRLTNSVNQEPLVWISKKFVLQQNLCLKLKSSAMI